MVSRIFIFLVSLSVFSSCAKDIYFKKEVNIQQLGVKLTYKDAEYPELKKVYEDELDTFITQFNSQKHLFTLNRVDSLSGTAMEVQIDKIKLVPLGRQIAIFPLTVACFASLAMIPLASIYIPKNKTDIGVLFTDDMCEQKHRKKRIIVYSSRSYFGVKKAQLRRHTRRINGQYNAFFATIEHAYQAHLAFYKRLK